MKQIISKESDKQTRRYDNDWLTVLAMLTIFFFHCARFFDERHWHVKNNVENDGLTLFVSIVVQWIMPLFFLLSGFSSYYSLRSRSGGQYIKNRFQRLIIPFIFGTLVFLIPVQVWIERVSQGQFDGSFIEFYPLYFNGFYAFGGNFAWMGLHLWYLEFLFIFTLLTFPFFISLIKVRNRKILLGAARFFEKPGTIYILGVPILLMELIVNKYPGSIGMRDFGGWSLLSYLIVFVTGFILAFDIKYRNAMEKSRYISLALALLFTGLMFFSNVDLSSLGSRSEYLLIVFVQSFNSWFWLVAILGFGSKYLNFDNRLLKYAREAVLPFYILHQTAIVIVGFYIVNWEIPVMVKFIILTSSSFISIMAVYEVLIKRFKVLRFLFGMKAIK